MKREKDVLTLPAHNQTTWWPFEDIWRRRESASYFSKKFRLRSRLLQPVQNNRVTFRTT